MGEAAGDKPEAGLAGLADHDAQRLALGAVREDDRVGGSLTLDWSLHLKSWRTMFTIFFGGKGSATVFCYCLVLGPIH